MGNSTETTYLSGADVPDNFTTYFGGASHGLFVNWKSVINSLSGTTEIEMAFTANMRQKLYIFADTGANDADDCATWTTALDVC